jgi:hypothetical protein
MKIFIILSFFLIPAVWIFPAPVKTPPQKTAPSKLIQPARTAVLISFDGFADQDDFLMSPENFNLNAVYQSLAFQIKSYSTSIQLADTGKAIYIPNLPGEDKKAMDALGIDYLIKLNLIKFGKASTLEISLLSNQGVSLMKNKIVFYEKMSPEAFESIYAIFNKTVKHLIQDFDARNLKKGIAPPEKVWVTNLTTINIINKVPVLDLSAGVGQKTKLHITGDFQYLELINSYQTISVTNQELFYTNHYPLDIYPGLNYLRVCYNPPNFGLNSWGFKSEQLFLIHNKSLKSTALDVNDYKHVPVTHFFVSIGVKKYLSIAEPLADFDIGFRFGMTPFQKIKLAITSVERKGFYSYGNYYLNFGIGLKFGYENKIGNLDTALDYALCWFIDGIVSEYKLGINSGVSLRFHPLLSFNAGVGLNYFAPSYSLPGGLADISFFIDYDLYLAFPNAEKNYVYFH